MELFFGLMAMGGCIKDRTKKELEDKLYRAGFSEKASKQAMDYVMSFGYIDDRRYVENYLMFQTGKRSKKEIYFKLQVFYENDV